MAFHHRRRLAVAIFALAFLACSRSGGADLSNNGPTRGLDADPFGRPGPLRWPSVGAGGAMLTADSWAQTLLWPSHSADASATSSVSTLNSTSSGRRISNSTTAPISDSSSHLMGRSGILGLVTASTSRDNRGRRKAACRGGEEQWAWSCASARWKWRCIFDGRFENHGTYLR